MTGRIRLVVGGRIGQSRARHHGRVGGFRVRGPGLHWRTTGRRSIGSRHEVGGGQALGGEARFRAFATSLGRGARFRMGIAIQATGEGLREASHHFGWAALRRLRLPLPASSNQHSRYRSTTRSRSALVVMAMSVAITVLPLYLEQEVRNDAEKGLQLAAGTGVVTRPEFVARAGDRRLLVKS